MFQSCHFVKSVCIPSYCGPYFSTFWLNTVRKLRITLNTNTFYGVWSSVDVFSGMEFCTFSFLSLGQDVFSYLSMRRFFFFFFFFFMNDGEFINYLLLLWKTFDLYNLRIQHSKQSFKNIIHQDIKSVKIYLSSM